ncbi:MAG: hypothetical protein ACI9J3_003102 [Parvicellaceae bacterium]|jgi:hypothetical protein
MTARFYFHISNLSSILFFAVITSNSIFKWEGTYIHSIWYLLAPLLLVGFLLTFLAKKKDPSVKNPVKEGKIARVLYYAGLIILLATVLLLKEDPWAFPLMIIGICAQVAGLFISFFVKSSLAIENAEITDDVDYEER